MYGFFFEFQMGMIDMFQNHANFSGIADTPLKVSEVIQKAFIEVNEEGSEAAAVTGELNLVKFTICNFIPTSSTKNYESYDIQFVVFIFMKWFHDETLVQNLSS